LHRRLQEQLAKTGKVRAIVLKARQLGISTYTASRFFKLIIENPGLPTSSSGIPDAKAEQQSFGGMIIWRKHRKSSPWAGELAREENKQ
jgi:hypothetical protein